MGPVLDIERDHRHPLLPHGLCEDASPREELEEDTKLPGRSKSLPKSALKSCSTRNMRVSRASRTSGRSSWSCRSTPLCPSQFAALLSTFPVPRR